MKFDLRSILHSRQTLVFLLLGVALFLAGCVDLQDPEASQEYRAEIVGVATPEQTLGQTFISRRPRLSSILLWISADPSLSPEAELIAELFHSPADSSPIATFSIPFSVVAKQSPVRLAVSPQAASAGQDYYLSLRSSDGEVKALGRNEDAYPGGQAYANGSPVEADLSFRLMYTYDLAALREDLAKAFESTWIAFPLAVILLLPGWLLLEFASPGRLDWGEKIGLSLALSLSIIPLAMMWTTFLNLPWSRTGVLVLSGLLVLIVLWRSRYSLPRLVWTRPSGFSLALASIFLFSLAVRLIMVRDLAAPAWVDSVHHALITRLIVEEGAFPGTYAPYLDINTAGYHPGFHSVLAAFHWLSGLEIPAAMLLFGQIMNALVVFSVYLFTRTLTGSQPAALVAALITGVLSPMPAYYTSWGRYTQLAGLLILPGALKLVIWLLDSPSSQKVNATFNSRRIQFLLATAVCAGLFLTHYRVAAFLALLFLAHLITQAVKYLAENRFIHRTPQEVGLLGAIGSFAIFLTLPWWLPTLETLIIPKYVSWGGRAVLFSDFNWTYLTAALGRYTLYAAGLGAILGILRRRWFTLTLILWVGLLFLLANLAAFGLPGGGLVNNLSVEITLFLPISTLGGYLAGEAITAGKRFFPPRLQKGYWTGTAGIGIVLAIVGARQLLPILNPVTLLFRQADYPAMTWVEQNLPPDSTVLINPFAWGYGLYAGNDGGYWITPLTGRKTLPPPVLYGFDNQAEKITQINATLQQVMERKDQPNELGSFLKSQDIGYVYIGGRGGILSAEQLQGSDRFRLLYAREGVWIFQVY